MGGETVSYRETVYHAPEGADKKMLVLLLKK